MYKGEKYEKEKTHIIAETKENLEKEKLIHKAKTHIYENLGINSNLEKNSGIKKFEKGVVDELIVGNYELAIEIINTKGKILFEALKELFSIEGIKQVLKSLKESAWDLFSGDAYKTGKSIVDLGLISTGALASFKIAKYATKSVFKNTAKNNLKMNFTKLSVEEIAKLGDKERLDVASQYLKKELSIKQKQAIIKAHEVGMTREGAGIYNYTFKEKAEKLKILEHAGFTKEERKLLLEKGICGKSIKEIKADIDRLKRTLENCTSPDKLKIIDVTNKISIEAFSKNIVNIATIVERINRDLPNLALQEQRELIDMLAKTLNKIDNFAIKVSENRHITSEQKRFITGNINSLYKDRSINIRRYAGKMNGGGIEHEIKYMHNYYQTTKAKI